MNYLLLIVLPLLLGLWAQMHVSGTYRRYSQVGARSRISGREAAEFVLRRFGISDVRIVPIGGMLTDHYNPTTKELALSQDNYHGTSLAALGVAAHEAGHAIQHAVGYKALQFRMALVPVTQIASRLLPFVIFGGFIFGMLGLMKLGVLVYLVLTVFHLVTLPVEFDASRRAKAELAALGLITPDERIGVERTLNAAGWTYVAAFLASLGNLIYLLQLTRNDD
jgi:Zn-dependent membrane protease YugP